MIPSFVTDLYVPLSSIFRRGAAWWVSELLAVVPKPLQQFAGGQSIPAATLRYGRTEAVFSLQGRTGSDPDAVMPCTANDEARRHIQAALHRHRRGNAVSIQLDPRLIYQTSLDLPAKAASSLRSILQHQLERIVPLPAHSVLFEYQLGPPPRDPMKLCVHIAVVKRTTLDQAIALAEAVGLSATSVVATTMATSNTPFLPPFTFWRAGQGNGRRTMNNRLCRILEVLIVLTAMAAYGSYVYRLGQARDHLQEELALVKPEAASVQDLARQVRREKESVGFFQARRHEPSPLYLLDMLTALVPQDSWIYQLTLHDGEVEMTGFSPHANELILRIETSATFGNPRFRSPITSSPDGKAERFHLTFNTRRNEAQ